MPNQDERAECYVGGVEDREGNRWSCRKHRLYKSRYWQVVSITIAPATVLYENSNDLCTDMRFAFAYISNVAHKKIVKVFDDPADCRDIEKIIDPYTSKQWLYSKRQKSSIHYEVS